MKKKQKILTFIIIVTVETVITMGTIFFIGSIIPIEATKKDRTLLENYDNLKELVGHIKNGNLGVNQISLNDFKNSDANQHGDENMRDCIKLAEKIGHNLGDYQQVHCFENENHYNQKYSIDNNIISNQNIKSGNRINNSTIADTNMTDSIAGTNATTLVTNMTGSIAGTNATSPNATSPNATSPVTNTTVTCIDANPKCSKYQ
ncbi:MAG TPA: hypothetical protein VJS91_07905 [Nitrososphaeraceae archaeon]|nr:hypothetical protein [Nitrososphaeraceae archaeon]